mgnify:FL=1
MKRFLVAALSLMLLLVAGCGSEPEPQTKDAKLSKLTIG